MSAPTSPSAISSLEAAQKAEILELEAQIRKLNTKVSDAVDHAADLQDELRTIKARERQELEARDLAGGETGLRRMSSYFTGRRASLTPSMLNGISPSQSISGPSNPLQPQQSGLGLPQRGGSLGGRASFSGTTGRQSIPNSIYQLPETSSTDTTTADLKAQLAAEQALRKEAEAKYKALQDESETLSQSLFEEANRMVSVERKMTHVVEEKLKAHVDREADRRTRLAVLESAVDRITRVRGVLAHVQAATASATAGPVSTVSVGAGSAAGVVISSPPSIVGASPMVSVQPV